MRIYIRWNKAWIKIVRFHEYLPLCHKYYAEICPFLQLLFYVFRTNELFYHWRVMHIHQILHKYLDWSFVVHLELPGQPPLLLCVVYICEALFTCHEHDPWPTVGDQFDHCVAHVVYVHELLPPPHDSTIVIDEQRITESKIKAPFIFEQKFFLQILINESPI